MKPEELVSAIKKTTLPTLCVEGTQDKTALRSLQEDTGISILICNGRNNLFEVWNRREEFKEKNIIFLADRDLFVLKRIPKQYHGIHFTYGYSIENDMLSSMRWENVMSQSDTTLFTQALEAAIDHYWHESRNFFSCNKDPQWKSTFKLMMEGPSATSDAPALKSNCSLREKIQRNPYRYLRGKNLLECIHFALSHKGREPRFSAGHIIEISTKPKPIGHYKNLLSTLKSKII